jgi:hypothetical protein
MKFGCADPVPGFELDWNFKRRFSTEEAFPADKRTNINRLLRSILGGNYASL